MVDSREELFTVEEAAEWLKVNPQTVRNWIDQRKLQAVYLGTRRVRIRESQLERFLTAGETKPVSNDERESPAPIRADELVGTMAKALRGSPVKDLAELAAALRVEAAAAEALAHALEENRGS